MKFIQIYHKVYHICYKSDWLFQDLGYEWCRLVSFFKSKTFKNIFGNTIRVSNSLDPDQDQRSVGPDLGPKLFAKVISRGQNFPASM